MSEVGQAAVKVVLGVNTFFVIKVLCGLLEHHLKKMVKKVSAKVQHCFTILLMGNCCDRLQFSETLPIFMRLNDPIEVIFLGTA